MRYAAGQMRQTAVEMMRASGRMPAVGSAVLQHPAERTRLPLRMSHPTADKTRRSERPAPTPAVEASVSAGMSQLAERLASIAGRKVPIPAEPAQGSTSFGVTSAFPRPSGDELIVLGMSANPDPVDAACFVN